MVDETRKIVILIGVGAFLPIAGFSYGILNLTEYYIAMFGGVIPITAGYAIWNLFIRKAFSIHWGVEECEHLVEVKYQRIVPFSTNGKTIVNKLGEFKINSRDALYTDRFNKIHLFFPIDNVFAFHPFATAYRYEEGKDDSIPNDLKATLIPEVIEPEKIETDSKGNIRPKYIIKPIHINFMTLMKVNALEFMQMFAGKLLIARVEEQRKQRDRQNRSNGFVAMVLLLGLMGGMFFGVFVYPTYSSLLTGNHNTQSYNTSTFSTYTPSGSTTTSTLTTQQTIPAGAKLIGQESIVSGNNTITYKTYANNSTTVTITQSTTG